MTKIYQYDIWIADLDRSEGTEPGKKLPVIIVQSNALNKVDHSSTIICLISSQVRSDISMLRIGLFPEDTNGLKKLSFILCDQVRSIDNNRLKERIGKLSQDKIEQLQKTLKAVLSLY